MDTYSYYGKINHNPYRKDCLFLTNAMKTKICQPGLACSHYIFVDIYVCSYEVATINNNIIITFKNFWLT